MKKSEIENGKHKSTTTTGNAARTATEGLQREHRRRNRGNVEAANWRDAQADILLECVARVSARNCAIQLGYTRDGGSFVIRIVGDGEPYNEYIRPSEDINAYLTGLAEDFQF